MTSLSQMRAVAVAYGDATKSRQLRDHGDDQSDYSDACDVEDDARELFRATFNPAVVLKLLAIAEIVAVADDERGRNDDGILFYQEDHIMALREALAGLEGDSDEP